MLCIGAIAKRFGATTVLENCSLDVAEGEIVTLLGPSGCGKTTLLRCVAGLEFPTEGSISIYGEEMGLRPPNKRPVNTVFQSYALFPHMTVAENIGFGLRMQKLDAARIGQRVGDVIELVRMSGMGDRRPQELSGGQQQRVALARALVNHPKVLLLDEPLGALDLKLRQAMQLELKEIQREVGITFVYVTHDQEEALTMSDRIAVMNEGLVLQIGEPEDIYERPANRFVADFIGESNFVAAVVEAPGLVRLTNERTIAVRTHSEAGSAVTITLRPEKIHLQAPAEHRPEELNVLEGVVHKRHYFGDSLYYELDFGLESTVDARVENRPGLPRYEAGDAVVAVFHPDAAEALSE